MINEGWCFYLILLLFIGSIINIILKTAAYKSTITYDANATERVMGVIMSLVFLIIYAIALGWI